MVDIPTAAYYQELLAHYGHRAKFVLTLRDEASWFASFAAYLDTLCKKRSGVQPRTVAALHQHVYGSAQPDAALWTARFRAHNAKVRALVPPEQLLVLDITNGDGWPQLCAFLGRTDGPCAGPVGGRPFPHLNTKAAIAASGEKEDVPCADTARARRCRVAADAPERKGKYAYVLSLAGRSPQTWSDYTRAALVVARALREAGAAHDVVVMLPAKSHPSLPVPKWVLRLLRKLEHRGDVRLVRVGRVGAALPRGRDGSRFGPAVQDIYRMKLRALQLVEYERVMYLDSDILVRRNLDGLFDALAPGASFVAGAGAISPLNSGWWVAEPSCQAFADVDDVAHGRAFTRASGWQQAGGPTDWGFYGASVDQGLLYHQFFRPDGTARGAEAVGAHAHRCKDGDCAWGACTNCMGIKGTPCCDCGDGVNCCCSCCPAAESPKPVSELAAKVSVGGNTADSGLVRLYAHCAREPSANGAVTLLVVNLNPQPANITILGNGGWALRTEYQLSPSKRTGPLDLRTGILGSGVLLNGVGPLELTAAGKLPNLSGRKAGKYGPLAVGPESIMFAVFTEAFAPACQ